MPTIEYPPTVSPTLRRDVVLQPGAAGIRYGVALDVGPVLAAKVSPSVMVTVTVEGVVTAMIEPAVKLAVKVRLARKPARLITGTLTVLVVSLAAKATDTLLCAT